MGLKFASVLLGLDFDTCFVLLGLFVLLFCLCLCSCFWYLLLYCAVGVFLTLVLLGWILGVFMFVLFVVLSTLVLGCICYLRVILSVSFSLTACVLLFWLYCCVVWCWFFMCFAPG